MTGGDNGCGKAEQENTTMAMLEQARVELGAVEELVKELEKRIQPYRLEVGVPEPSGKEKLEKARMSQAQLSIDLLGDMAKQIQQRLNDLLRTIV